MPTSRRLHFAVSIACALVLLFSGAMARASLVSGLPRLMLTHHASPSGDWVLSIDPSSRDGTGPTHYTMRHREAIVWKTTLPYALWEVAVADDGRSAGAGYDTGYGAFREDGNFIVALFDAQGRQIAVDKTPRSGKETGFHDSPYPHVEAVWLDAERNTATVRVREYITARKKITAYWWYYDLDSGTRIRVVEPQQPHVETDVLRDVRQNLPLPGTPLVLTHVLHWADAGDNHTAYGSHYVLFDAEGQPIWQLLLPGDIATGQAYPHERINQLKGLRSQLPGHFSVQSLQRDVWLEFQAIEDHDAASGWRIEALGETPVVAEEAAPELPQFELMHLGSINLADGRPPDALQRIEHFAIDAQGRIGVIDRPADCACEAAGYRLSLYSAEGVLLASRSLDALEMRKNDNLHIAALANGEWLLTVSPHPSHLSARAFVFDAQIQAFKPLADFNIQFVQSLASNPTGGFVVLERRHNHYFGDRVHSYDSHGQRRWLVGSDSKDEHALLGPEAITVLRDGSVVVLENASKGIKRYDANGKHLETIDLESIWPYPPDYLKAIAADADGGFWILDSHDKEQLVHMDHASKAITPLARLRYGNGRVMSTIGHIVAGPDGSLWAEDYMAVFQFDAAGQALFNIGIAPDIAHLSELETLSITPDGQILTLDGRSRTLHHFDADGRLLRTMLSHEHDFPLDADDLSWVMLMPNGEALAGWSSTGYLHFNADGQRTGYRHFSKKHEEFGRPLPHVRMDRLWWQESDGISLISPDGTAIVRHERDANAQWFSLLTKTAMAPDGSLAIADKGSDGVVITLLNAQGQLLASWPLPLDEYDTLRALTFDGHTVIALLRPYSEDNSLPLRLVGLDSRGNALFRTEVQAPNLWAAFHVQRGGVSELWLHSSEMQIERYDWPQAAPAEVPRETSE